VPGGDVHLAHRERERRADEHDVGAGPDQPAHAPQRLDVIVDVLEDVVGDQAGMLGPLRGRQGDLAHRHAGVGGHLLLELKDRGRIRIGGSEAAHQRDPFPGVVAEAAADLDRAVAEIRLSKLREPLPVVPAFGERGKHVALDLAVTPDLRHVAGYVPPRTHAFHPRYLS